MNHWLECPCSHRPAWTTALSQAEKSQEARSVRDAPQACHDKQTHSLSVLLDGTKTAFRQVHARASCSIRPFACISKKKLNISFGQRSVDAINSNHRWVCRSTSTLIYIMLSVTAFDPKGTISEVRVHASTTLMYTFGHWTLIDRQQQILHQENVWSPW